MGPETLHRHAREAVRDVPAMDLAELQMLSGRDSVARSEAVRAAVGRMLVEHTQMRDARGVLEETLAENLATPPGAKTLLAVTGPNTVGKTTFVRAWALGRYREYVDPPSLASSRLPSWCPEPGIEADLVPILWVTLESATAKTSLDVELLAAAGHHVGRAPSVHRTIELVVRHGVRLVIIDDVHFLRTERVWGRQALDHLKKLNTELGEYHISMVLVGANLETTEIFADPQITGRLRTVRLNVFGVDTPMERVAWQQLLKEFERQLCQWLPGTTQGAIYRSAAGLVARRTQGYLRDIHTLFVGATRLAIADGSWAITPDILARVPLSERATTAETALTRRRANRKAS